MSSLDYLDLCRLCLVKDRVSVPIFEGEGNVRQIFLKIAACLPVKVAREDKLPKKICDDCVYKVELFYQFWNTTVNAEKQLLQWLGEVNLEDKQGYIANVLTPGVMKQEQSTENRLDGNVMQQVGEHQNNMGMGMMENMGLGIPMMISSANQQQQITSVPMDTGNNPVQTVQAVPGPSTQTTHNQISQNQTSSTQQEDEEESSEDDDNSDDECDPDDGLPVKEESEEDPNNRTIEPTTFVNVSLACDEAGPSGLQQQKIADIPEMPMPQQTDGDPKSGEYTEWNIEHDKTSKRGYTRNLQNPSTKHHSLEDYPSYNSILNLKLDTKDRSIRKQNTNTEESILPREQLNLKIFEQDEDIEVDEMLAKIKNTCPVCEKCFDNSRKVASHVTWAHRQPYKCDMCKKTCHSVQALEKHKIIHRSDYFFECQICRVKYKSEFCLKRHEVRAHSDVESKYVCDHCGRCYKLKIDLAAHIKKSHANEWQMCRICGKQVRNVKIHEWKHQRRKEEAKNQHACHVCSKKFRYRSRLDSHLRRHEEGFKCQECGKEFLGNNALLSHKKYKHSPENASICALCRKEFYSISNYYQHVLTHAGIRLYKCDVCEEDFTQRSSLLRHRKSHPGPLEPFPLTKPQIAEVAKSYLLKLQTGQIDKSSVLNAKL